MPAKVKVSFNIDKLNSLIADIHSKKTVKIGIFSGNNSRDSASQTNAEIGAEHEFGSFSKGLPSRSFLRMPLEMKSEDLLKDIKKIIANNLGKPNFKEIVLELTGIAGEAIIQEAFETGGFGMWLPISDETAAKKGSSEILIDSSQLRRSIISKVTK